MMKRSGIFLHLLLLILITGCATRRADPTHYPPPPEHPSAVALVKTVEYYERGRPVFGDILKEQPDEDGDRFVLVHYADSRPVQSFDVVVTGEKPDMMRPLKVIYEWTGKGFKAGIGSGKAHRESVETVQRRTDINFIAARPPAGS